MANQQLESLSLWGLLFLYVSLFADVDTIQKLSDIFPLHSCGLLEESRWKKSIELQVRTWTCSSCKNMQPIYMHSRCFLENNFRASEYIIMHETSRFLRNFSRFHNFLPDLETNSMSFPSRISSSFCAVEALHVTPGNMTTFRVNFSPKKFLTSTFVKLGSIATLMGKWAYTDLILYL